MFLITSLIYCWSCSVVLSTSTCKRAMLQVFCNMRCCAKLPPEEFITMRFRSNSCSVNDWICRRDAMQITREGACCWQRWQGDKLLHPCKQTHQKHIIRLRRGQHHTSSIALNKCAYVTRLENWSKDICFYWFEVKTNSTCCLLLTACFTIYTSFTPVGIRKKKVSWLKKNAAQTRS